MLPSPLPRRLFIRSLLAFAHAQRRARRARCVDRADEPADANGNDAVSPALRGQRVFHGCALGAGEGSVGFAHESPRTSSVRSIAQRTLLTFAKFTKYRAPIVHP